MDADLVRPQSRTARDVVLLVLEELTVSSPFRSWVLESVALDADAAPIAVREPNRGGEPNAPDPTTLARFEVGVETETDRIRVRVTTALGADATTALDRGELNAGGTLEGEWDDDRTVLLAPAASGAAADACESVDATLSLETLRERFAARETDRGDYRAALVGAAIDRGERAAAARATASGRRSTVVERYESLAADRDLSLDVDFGTGAETDLERVEEGADPFADGTPLTIHAPSLGADHRLVHDLESGTVDLRIPDVGDRLEIFAARYAGVIPTTTTLLTAGDAVVLRQSVPALDSADVDSETDADLDDRIDAAVEAVGGLLAVAERVRERTG